MKRAMVTTISLLMIALAGWAHASDTSETPEICRNTEEWGELNKVRKTTLKFICERMPLAQEMEKEKIRELPGCKGYPLTKSDLRRAARMVIKAQSWGVLDGWTLTNYIEIRTRACVLARLLRLHQNETAGWMFDLEEKIQKLKNELRRLREEKPKK